MTPFWGSNPAVPSRNQGSKRACFGGHFGRPVEESGVPNHPFQYQEAELRVRETLLETPF